jgi:hypothetical protein
MFSHFQFVMFIYGNDFNGSRRTYKKESSKANYHSDNEAILIKYEYYRCAYGVLVLLLLLALLYFYCVYHAVFTVL